MFSFALCETPLLVINSSQRIIEQNYAVFDLINDPTVSVFMIPLSGVVDFFIDKNTKKLYYNKTVEEYGTKRIIIIGQRSDCVEAKIINLSILDIPQIVNKTPSQDEVLISIDESLSFRAEVIDKDDFSPKHQWLLNNKTVSDEKIYFFRSNPSKNISIGNHTLQLKIIDDFDLSTQTSWHIQVFPSNLAPYMFSDFPEYAWISDNLLKTASLDNYFSDPEGTDINFKVRFFDENKNDVTIDYELLPTGEILLKNSNGFKGLLFIEITAKDEIGLESKGGIFKIVVVPKEESIDVRKIVTHVCGDRVCGGIENCDNCQDDCGPCAPGQLRCEKKWVCEEWSQCYTNGVMVRECADTNQCYDISERPATFSFCSPTATCFDKIKNQNEDKIDCGGFCGACPTCYDRKQNQGEQGIDCEGPCKNKCPTCTDGILNGQESDIDCGGKCGLCIGGKTCYSYKDCESYNCKNFTCASPTCFDGIMNHGEEGVDCEGPCNIVCPTCFDAMKNQDEESIDCGGSCDAGCPTCFDGIKNQDEWLVDCGATCGLCNKIIIPPLVIILTMFLALFIVILSVSLSNAAKKGLFDDFKVKVILLLIANIKPKNSKELIDNEGHTKQFIKNLESILKEEFSSTEAYKEKIMMITSEYYMKLFNMTYGFDPEEAALKIGEVVGFPYNAILKEIFFESITITKTKTNTLLLNDYCKRTIKALKIIEKKISSKK